ncbi:MAG: NUDIX hydrolase [Dehalococcoidia bacterium]
MLRKGPDGSEVAVIHRPKYGDFTLPKGKLEAGESFEQAATREVLEETGVEARITGFVEVVSYYVGKAPKLVVYFRMNHENETPFQSNHEVDELQWLRPGEAHRLLSYGSEKLVLAKAMNLNDEVGARG